MNPNRAVELRKEIKEKLAEIEHVTTGVVLFVDLCGSTEYKLQHPKQVEWLPWIAEFLLEITKRINEKGRVVKYIGDC